MIYGALQDITELREAEERIRLLALIDTLTGLPNRTQFKNHLAQAVALAKHHGHCLALLFLDLGNFEQINDTFGHAVGDLLLQSTAKRLIASGRTHDKAAQSAVPYLTEDLSRLDGDKFTLLLPEIQDRRDAVVVAKRIQGILSQHVTLAGHEILATPSVGIAIYPKDGDEPEALMKRADAALRCAKQQGKR